MKKTALILGFLMVFAASTAAFANHHGGKSCGLGGGCHHGQSCCNKGGESQCPLTNMLLEKAHMALEHSKELGLTAEQVQNIRSIKIETKKHVIRGTAEMQIMELDMKVVMKGDTFDAEAVKAMIDKGVPAWADNAKKVVDWYAAFRAELKPEQWAKLKELK